MSKPFTKRKLNREALDAFALKYSDATYPGSSKKIPYTTADGKTVNLNTAEAIIRRHR